ncbi:MAG: hypothetical protein MI725_11815 [Pirellulales bacterium]|nr:hypothetical protein [Pirellulales bacterium]
MSTKTRCFFVIVIAIFGLCYFLDVHSLQNCFAGETKRTESPNPDEQELAFDKKMNRLFLSGTQGKASSYQEIVSECDQQENNKQLTGLAKAWKGTALIMQCGPLFQSGNWQDGLKKWNGGLELIKQADETDDSLVTKKQITSISLASWQYANSSKRKKEIARLGLKALQSIRGLQPAYWANVPLQTKVKLLTDAVKVAQMFEDRKLAQQYLAELTKIAPDNEQIEKLKTLLESNGQSLKAERKTSSIRFDELVREDFFAGITDGDVEAFARAMSLCKSTLASDPQHYEAMVWLGSGRLFEAGIAEKVGNQAEAKKLWNEGLKLMHQACAAAPDDVSVLIPRAASLLKVGRVVPIASSERLGLLHLAVYDYERTLELQSSYFDNLSSHAKGELLLGLGDGWHQLKNKKKADEYFRQVLEAAPNSEQAELSKMFLSGKVDNSVLAQRSCSGCH